MKNTNAKEMLRMSIEDIEGNPTKIVFEDDNSIVFEFLELPVVALITEDQIKFSVDIASCQDLFGEDEEENAMLAVSLLELNSRIDPVAVAIDASNEDNPTIVAKSTLNNIDLQDAEIDRQISGLVYSIPEIKKVIEESKTVTA